MVRAEAMATGDTADTEGMDTVVGTGIAADTEMEAMDMVAVMEEVVVDMVAVEVMGEVAMEDTAVTEVEAMVDTVVAVMEDTEWARQQPQRRQRLRPEVRMVRPVSTH